MEPITKSIVEFAEPSQSPLFPPDGRNRLFLGEYLFSRGVIKGPFFGELSEGGMSKVVEFHLFNP